MNFKDQKPSQNFEDRTGWSDRDRFLNSLFVKINPFYALRNLHEALLKKGWIQPPEPTNLWKDNNAR